mgnify:CR=1 FL=1
MQIFKDVEQKTGVVVGYWEATRLTIDVLSNTARLEISGWLSKSAKDNGKDPITVKAASVQLSEIKPKLNELNSIAVYIYDRYKPYFGIEETLPAPAPPTE